MTARPYGDVAEGSELWALFGDPEAQGPSRASALERAAAAMRAMQAHAGRNIRRHLGRAALRVATLVFADLAAFDLVRVGIRLVRDLSAESLMVGEFLSRTFAEGYLGGWHYAVALLIGLAVTGNYGAGDRRRDGSRLVLAAGLATALSLWETLWTAPLVVTLLQYAATVVVVGATLVAERMVVDALVRRYGWHNAAARAVLVGSAADCARMRARRALQDRDAFSLIGFVDLGPTPDRLALGGLDDLERILHEHAVDTVILCGPTTEDVFSRVGKVAILAECQVLAVSRAFELAGMAPAVVWRRGQAFIELRAPALRGQQLVLKRAVDIALAGCALLALAPVFAVIGLAVRLNSRGPVLFRQRRLGRHGRVFHCLKFRSMYVDAEARLKADPVLYSMYVANDYKLPDGLDTRVTRVGRFLRRTSLDELPQLWNVLRGDMSLVGPRPIVPAEINEYQEDAPVLLSLKPGITGAWQVNGRSRVAYPKRAQMELEYVQEWSLVRDLSLLVRTIPAVVSGRGAH